ncbi:hypothetical protein OIU77_017160 [Salix suchowensis]|uniref:Uncharacterized protein n=1 Tax=Salix suchowensis TaxID=1278906 RepID=A0ABQ8ZN02_9ROSI|nr:hypothetical protein OIU77_017160 [Salix suchowensis]
MPQWEDDLWLGDRFFRVVFPYLFSFVHVGISDLSHMKITPRLILKSMLI